MGKIIAVANQKGGVGKTTTAVNVSSCIAVAEKKTLLVDMDPQSNATSGLGVDHKNIKVSTYEVILKNAAVEQAIVQTEINFLSLLPASIRLVGAEVELVNLIGREKALRDVLYPLRDEFDFIIIDCPPSLGLLTINSLTAADSVLIPIQCEYYALEGLSQLLNTVRLVQKNLNPPLEIEGVLLTMFNNRLNLSHQVTDEVRNYFGDRVFKTVVHRNVRLSEAPSFGKPVILYDAVCTGSEQYMSVAEEILRHEN